MATLPKMRTTSIFKCDFFNTWANHVVKAHYNYYTAAPYTENLIDFEEESRDAVLEENLTLLHQFIDQLNALNKALMILYFDNHSYQEMAEILGITETNVATKSNRIKHQRSHKLTMQRPSR